MRDLAFAALAAALLLGGLAAATARSLARAAAGLAAALLATAGIYGLLGSPLLAAIQILLYTGGVLTLAVFAIVVTGGTPGGPRFRRPVPAAGLAFATGAALLAAVRRLPAVPAVGGLDRGKEIGAALTADALVPFELLSVLLLAAVMGALLLARKDREA